MSTRTAVSTLVTGMFLTGCANSLLTKYQDKQCVENCGPGQARVDFEQPVWQTLNMFIGEFGCCLPLIYRMISTACRDGKPLSDSLLSAFRIRTSSAGSEGYSALAQDDDGHKVEDNDLTGWRICLLWFPAFFDICGTTLMNVGLILTPVSIYQMSRGALVLWVGVLSVIFLRRHLWIYQWVSLIIVTLGVCLVGLSGSLIKKVVAEDPDATLSAMVTDDDSAKVVLGVMLILFAQIFTASQYVVEEKIMARYHVEPMAAVTYEGFFGLVTTLAAMPILHVAFSKQNAYFDIPRGWHQIISTPAVLWSCVAIMISIGSFNFFGLSVTTRVSATTRSTIDTCRTLGIWIVSLGVGWERLIFPISLLQVAGFALLVYGTMVFNGVISPACCPPPSDLQLPREDVLEETGDVPAAAGQSRVGYDVIADRD